jgi:hypothetical protein
MQIRSTTGLAAALVVGGVMLGAGRPAVAMDSLTGEIVDMACYLPHGESMRGPGHRKCAETCIKKGLPMGLVTDDKQVFVLLEDHDNPKPYAQLKEKAAEKVTIEGEKVSQGGTQGFVVEAIK